ncbi:glycosyltransferase family 4 protein [Mesonia sp. HuA40]|uniref:glycosyltransferase family 4 protein n=1 Tax=Mesonia sp. HuA40 TaxID=2602761 RepID=UPI0011CBA33E|nr:glycosyltransferase family 4 protein [Mesonia sp. HuA40]TXK71929.1 glycosyltransferase family 4 protein [Mesonia sp. HuA40]
MSNSNKILIVYGSLNSVPSPEGAAPAKVIQETIEALNDDRFIVLSNTNLRLKDWDYDREVFRHVAFNHWSKLSLLLLKLRFNYSERKQLFITGSDAQLHYFITVCLYVRKHQYKKIIVHVSPGLVSMLKLFCPDVEIVFYHHGTSLHTKLTERQWEQLLHQTKGIIGVNLAAKIKANETFRKQIKEQYFRVYNGISSMKLSKSEKFKNFTVLFSGRICREKGVLDLIKAIRNLSDKGLNVNLILAGGAGTKRGLAEANKYLEKCKVYVNTHNLNVTFTGYLEKKALQKLYNQVHVLVLPTDAKLSSEGLSLSLIEGLSAGLPLIATAVGGNVEIVIENQNGFLIHTTENREKEIANYIEYLLLNPEQYNKISSAAESFYLKNFTPLRMSSQFINCLKKIDFVN